jgi:hypothetical protein
VADPSALKMSGPNASKQYSAPSDFVGADIGPVAAATIPLDLAKTSRSEIIPRRTTPEVRYLFAELGARMPYRAASKVLRICGFGDIRASHMAIRVVTDGDDGLRNFVQRSSPRPMDSQLDRSLPRVSSRSRRFWANASPCLAIAERSMAREIIASAYSNLRGCEEISIDGRPSTRGATLSRVFVVRPGLRKRCTDAVRAPTYIPLP